MTLPKFEGVLSSGDSISLGNGLSAVFQTMPDDTASAPWEKEEGHGAVREVPMNNYGYPDKKPGERILWKGRCAAFVYDFAGAIEQAASEGWSVPDSEKQGFTPEAAQALAVAQDMNYLRGWLADEWRYISVTVSIRDDETGNALAIFSLWEVSDYDQEYVRDTANDCLHEAFSALRTGIAARVSVLAKEKKRLESLQALYPA